ncbi:MAG: hypothetical protein AAF632_05215 [Bacteroidota bacterium]
MNFLKKLTRTQKILAVAGTVVAAGVFFLDDSEDEYDTYDNYYNEAQAYQEDGQPTYAAGEKMMASTPASFGDGDGKVVIYDKGLQMPISTVILPKGWKVDQDIAFDPNTARPVRFKLDYTGPNDELFRMFMEVKRFGAMTGKSFEQAYREAIPNMIGNELTQVSVGNIKPSPEAEALPQFQKVIQKLSRQGMRMNVLEVEISGQRNGQPYKGALGFMKGVQPTAMGEAGILMPFTILLAPANHFENSLAFTEEIGKNTVSNPAHEQRMEQINQRAMQQIHANGQQRMQQAQAAHQQRMANRQAAFDAHQKNIQSMGQIQDASYNSYMNNLRNSGSYSSSGSNYSSQDAFVDQIYERSTFNDPYSGQEMNLDGQYDYNYTNGLGDYYRTDDPSFDPNSMQGDWQQIDPQYPY